jgi:hypothetical protein
MMALTCLVRHSATRRKVSGSIPGRALGNFEVFLASTQKSVPRNFLSGKGRPAPRADNSAVLVVPYVKMRIEDQRSIRPLGLHDLFRIFFLPSSYKIM